METYGGLFELRSALADQIDDCRILHRQLATQVEEAAQLLVVTVLQHRVGHRFAQQTLSMANTLARTENEVLHFCKCKHPSVTHSTIRLAQLGGVLGQADAGGYGAMSRIQLLHWTRP